MLLTRAVLSAPQRWFELRGVAAGHAVMTTGVSEVTMCVIRVRKPHALSVTEVVGRQIGTEPGRLVQPVVLLCSKPRDCLIRAGRVEFSL